MQTRREVLRRVGFLGLGWVLVTIPLACAQNSRDPAPFQTGAVVSPPIGCSQLREADSAGDC